MTSTALTSTALRSLDNVARFTASGYGYGRCHVDQRIVRGLIRDGYIVEQGVSVWATEKGLRAAPLPYTDAVIAARAV